MKKLFGYIRVSTVRQGEFGVSLEQQRDAISKYAARNGFEVVDWFEERQTAAKRGRPVFNQMLKLLRQRKAAGVIIHKIDRSARNLKDWADLGELIDQGTEVHFANETLDLHSRGGRLSADIQAVVAADYIRNLREETKKGLYGRLKQGIYPLGAPIGYLDMGTARAKEIDPERAPLVRKLFELYATSRYTLATLLEEARRLGLRNKRGGVLSLSGLSGILNNPFYTGVIRIKRTGECFDGIHKPIVSRSLFETVAAILKGRTPDRQERHGFAFRKLLRCALCGYSLIGERQKGHVYYRCHTDGCPTRSVREEFVNGAALEALSQLQWRKGERSALDAELADTRAHWTTQRDAQARADTIELSQIDKRLDRLVDAYADGILERDLFEKRKGTLIIRRRELQERREGLADPDSSLDRLRDFLELAGSAYLLYANGSPEDKRAVLRTVTSNRSVHQKNVVVTLSDPFRIFAERAEMVCSPHHRGRPRTFATLATALFSWCEMNHDKLEILFSSLPPHLIRPSGADKTAKRAA